MEAQNESSEYKIERWDVVYDEKLNIKRPLIYIVPDKPLIEFAKINIDNLYVTMNGTGIECYDGIKLKASLISSANYPNRRPNFFDVTGYYVVVLKDAIWLGYPKKLGTVNFQGKVNLIRSFEEVKPTSVPSEIVSPVVPSLTPVPTSMVEGFAGGSIELGSKSNWFIIILILLFIILFIVRFIINRNAI